MALAMGNMKEKYKDPQHFMEPKDPKLPPEEMLEVESAQLRAAKDAELLKTIRVRFIEEGSDRTIDSFTKFPKTVNVEGMSAQETIFELRQKIAEQESIPVEDVNLFCANTSLEDNMTISDCYVDWMGFGLEDWPPRFIVKPRIKGFEVVVDVPAMRDTSVWDNGRMTSYLDRNLVFDVDAHTRVTDLKGMLAAKLNIPGKRQKLTALIRKSLKWEGEYVELSDDLKSLGDYELDKFCVCVKFEKNPFDENGDYVFDDAYFDATGYHPQPIDCWIPQDSIADRSRPDAQKVDPNQPLSIVSDRRAKEAQG